MARSISSCQFPKTRFLTAIPKAGWFTVLIRRTALLSHKDAPWFYICFPKARSNSPGNKPGPAGTWCPPTSMAVRSGPLHRASSPRASCTRPPPNWISMKKLANYVQGRWQEGTGEGTTLYDPVLGTPLVKVCAKGVDMAAAFDHARTQAGPALRRYTYAERAGLLAQVAQVLQASRDKYYDISLQNSGTVKNDTAVDVEGSIYTLGYYAKLGSRLVDGQVHLDGDSTSLAKDNAFASQHIEVPVRGVALLINAFNFPAWGLWEKAAPALLSGVPVVVKPATATAWLTHEMVKDVIEAGILPEGSISIVCGRPEGLLDALNGLDLVSFTGSAETAATLRQHPRIQHDGVRFNAETDSVNCALLDPEATGSDLLVREVVRELTIKSGQKCTAIRRIFVPEASYDAVAKGICEKLQGI